MLKKFKTNFKKLSYRQRFFLVFIACLVILTTIGITFSRYIYDNIKDFYFSSKKFYFNSDKLAEVSANYRLDNWSGVDPYTIIVNMNSNKNSLVSSDTDIAYDITYGCSNTVICQSTKNSGVIYATSNTDTFSIIVTPNAAFRDGDQVIITISTTSTSPYEKTIAARFILKVGKIGLSYEITDEPTSPYLEMRVTNTLDYYLVRTAFGTYNVGDRIDIDSYLNLSQANKDNCASVIITLGFDPNIVPLDMTNPSYLRKIASTTTTINGHDYINNYSFKLDALSSETIKFYKSNVNNDYTYPIVNSTSIISFAYN